MTSEHDPRRCFPGLPTCGSGDYGCRETARQRLDAPDGEPVPGGWYCPAHGVAIVTEYAEKLGETWTLRPLHQYDAATCAGR